MATNIGNSEIRYWLYKDINGKPIFQLTSNALKTRFYLYKISDNGEYTKLGGGKDPIELENKFDVRYAMFGQEVL